MHSHLYCFVQMSPWRSSAHSLPRKDWPLTMWRLTSPHWKMLLQSQVLHMLVCGGLNLILQWTLFGESCLIYTCIMENRPINCSCMHFIATIHMAYWMLYPPPGITDRVWGGGRERCHLINFTLWIEVICLYRNNCDEVLRCRLRF